MSMPSSAVRPAAFGFPWLPFGFLPTRFRVQTGDPHARFGHECVLVVGVEVGIPFIARQLLHRNTRIQSNHTLYRGFRQFCFRRPSEFVALI